MCGLDADEVAAIGALNAGHIRHAAELLWH
jgi:hypothetical protein